MASFVARPIMENKIKEQKCTKCKKWKLLNTDNFGVNRAYPTGFLMRCKPCVNKKARENRHRKWLESYEGMYDQIEFGPFEKACLLEEIGRGKTEKYSMWS